MSTAARRRLMRDFRRLQEDPPMGVSGAPGENNIMIWNAVIFGPHETPFEDGTFKLTISKYIDKYLLHHRQEKFSTQAELLAALKKGPAEHGPKR